MKTIHVNVTQEKIDNGRHMTCCSCPIALSAVSPATQVEYPKVDAASVHIDDGMLAILEEDQPRKAYKFKLPKIAQDFVRDWNANKEVSPISFDIVPKLWGKCGARVLTTPSRYELETI